MSARGTCPFLIQAMKFKCKTSKGANVVREQRVLRASGTRLAPTELEARPWVRVYSA